MGQIYQEGYYVRKCPFFVNFEQGLLTTGQSWDVQFFPVLLVSLATARKHWLRYFSLPRPPAPRGATQHQVCLQNCFLSVASETKKMGKI